MNRKRAEPFLIVLQALRRGLREGRLVAEQRLVASEIALELNLSATPVREALARLAGEGLVEDRRGQGYFVRRLTALDVADLYRMSHAQLLIALGGRGVAPMGVEEPPAGEAEENPGARVERLFDRWVLGAAGAALLESHRRTQARLAPVRRVEGLVLDGLDAEARDLAALWAAVPRERAAAVGAYYRRRLRVADRLAARLESWRPIAPI